MASLIYKVTNKVNGKVYVGQTTQSLPQRITEHRSRLNAGERNHKLYLAMRKHGFENFEFETLCCAVDERFLDELEIQFIKEFNSYNRGYNSSEGGGSISPETRAKLSRIFKGRKITWTDKIVASRKSNPNCRSPKEWVAAGAKHTKAKRYRIRKPDGSMVVFGGLREFCRNNELDHKTLIDTLKGVQSHHKGYVLLERFND